MSQHKHLSQVIEEFRKTISKIGTMPDTDFDIKFHETIWNIEKHFKHCPQNRKSLIDEFMSATNSIFELSIMSNHSRTKPLGYAGDHQLIDMIYQKAIAESEAGRKLDEFFHRQKAPTAVRNRKSFFINTFCELCDKRAEPSVLDIACGPCRDVAEAITHAGQRADGAMLHCIDMDPRAISYAQDVVAPVRDVNIRLQATNAFRFRPSQRYDLVWSAGLFDYLEDNLAAVLLRKMWKATSEGGEVIVGNFHVSNPDRPWMEWCGDWHLIHRTEDDMLHICRQAGIPVESVCFHYEPTGINMFLRILK
ncbi:MAG: class I SAM-dependent methyltransferase [Desulfuromonadaceae bacterium]|nr:class I SAM-dependent methyltransferase [Desulfuromonadaceae bacterium]